MQIALLDWNWTSLPYVILSVSSCGSSSVLSVKWEHCFIWLHVLKWQWQRDSKMTSFVWAPQVILDSRKHVFVFIESLDLCICNFYATVFCNFLQVCCNFFLGKFVATFLQLFGQPFPQTFSNFLGNTKLQRSKKLQNKLPKSCQTFAIFFGKKVGENSCKKSCKNSCIKVATKLQKKSCIKVANT